MKTNSIHTSLKKKSCGCEAKRTTGEIKVAQLLKENNFSFEEQFTF